MTCFAVALCDVAQVLDDDDSDGEREPCDTPACCDQYNNDDDDDCIVSISMLFSIIWKESFETEI